MDSINYRIVETDNYGGDYPDESFHGPLMTETEANEVCALFNKYNRNDRRFYFVAHYTRKLQPGFSP